MDSRDLHERDRLRLLFFFPLPLWLLAHALLEELPGSDLWSDDSDEWILSVWALAAMYDIQQPNMSEERLHQKLPPPRPQNGLSFSLSEVLFVEAWLKRHEGARCGSC